VFRPIAPANPSEKGLFLLVEDVGEVAAAAVLAVVHGGHEDTGTAGVGGALAAETLNLAVGVDLVVLEDGQLGLLALVLDLLGGGVDLLLALLATTTQAQHQVEGGLLLDVVVGQGAAVLELLSGEDQALLVGGDALLVLDLGLDIVDGVGRLHLEGDSLAREGLHEDLHDCLLARGLETIPKERALERLLSGLSQCPLFFSLSLSLELSPGERQWVMVVIWATADRFYNVAGVRTYTHAYTCTHTPEIDTM